MTINQGGLFALLNCKGRTNVPGREFFPLMGIGIASDK